MLTAAASIPSTLVSLLEQQRECKLHGLSFAIFEDRNTVWPKSMLKNRLSYSETCTLPPAKNLGGVYFYAHLLGSVYEKYPPQIMRNLIEMKILMEHVNFTGHS